MNADSDRIARDAEREAADADPRLLTGRAILHAPAAVPAIWGDGARVAWPEGEALLVTGPPGVAKSTLAQRLAGARAGIGSGRLLDLPVRPDPERIVLYIAADRPPQVLRSWRRMVGPEHEAILRERVRIWRGPLDFDVADEPDRLRQLAQAVGAGTVVIDSIKDVARGTSEEDGGSGITRALQLVLAAGIEVVAIHHNRKATSENKRPERLADVYGSTWIAAGAGSVLGVFGDPGATTFLLRHLKQPADEVGPFTVALDKATGGLARIGEITLHALVAAHPDGLSARDAAKALNGTQRPDKAQIEAARRELERGVADRWAERVDGHGDHSRTHLYRPIDHRQLALSRTGRVDPVDPRVDPLHDHSTQSTAIHENPCNNGAQGVHAALHEVHTGGQSAGDPLKGARAPAVDPCVEDDATPPAEAEVVRRIADAFDAEEAQP